jgi:hypothetical protein
MRYADAMLAGSKLDLDLAEFAATVGIRVADRMRLALKLTREPFAEKLGITRDRSCAKAAGGGHIVVCAV